MTEQEYKAKQNELKQVRQNITDFGKRENELRREIAQYETKEYLNKYFYDNKTQTWVKPFKLHGEEIICMTITTYKDADYYFEQCFFEQEYYWAKEFSKFKEVSEEEFRNGVNKILKEAKKTIFGDEK